MSYGQWKIDETATFNEFGYNSCDLTIGTHKPVKCVCNSCGIVGNQTLNIFVNQL